MANVLELLLLAKDKMSPAVQRLLKLFKQAEKDGKSGANAIDKLTKKLERAPKSDGLKKQNAELKKTTTEAEKAAKAQEKLNNARRRKSPDTTTAKEVANKTRLASATEKAARAEEKLNNARRRRRPSGIGSTFEEDLLAGGTGAGMLWGSKRGMTAAMTKQEAMTDLYSAFYRSSLSAAELNSQMLRGEKIADSLGNKLPGTTSDYIQMFETMKQRGIEAEVVLNGAGKAAAYLAVANKEDRTEVGENIARFGQMFNLRTEQEYMSAADLLSRAKTAYKISTSELMEAVKDFSGRTGKGLGLEGSKGAEDTLKYLAFLRAKTGMEGLTVGNAASSFFNQYLQAKQKRKDPTDELKKISGVDLKIFDEKGKFLGLENAVKEFSKLKGKLSDEQMVSFGNALAGEEGASIFQAMVKDGDQFAAFNKELAESISLEEKSAKNAENLTNKIEALTGSLENLGAASFGPMLKPLGRATEGLNDFVGYLTEAAKANPVTAATTASIVSLAGAYLTFKAGSGLISSFLNRSRGEIDAVGKSATRATNQVSAFRRGLTGLKGALGVTLRIAGIIGLEYAIEKAINSYLAAKESQKNLGKAIKTNQAVTDKALSDPNLSDKTKQEIAAGNAQTTLFTLRQAGLFKTFGLDKSNDWGQSILDKVFVNPFENGWKNYDKQKSVKTFQSEAGVLSQPSVMKEFLKLIPERISGNDAASVTARNQINETLAQAFPESYKQATQELAASTTKLSEQSGQLSTAFSNMLTPTEGLVTPMGNLSANTTNATTSVNNMSSAAQGFANRVNSLELKPPTFAPIQMMYAPTSPTIPTGIGKAKGGSVTKGKGYPVGEMGMEWFVPNQSGSIISNEIIRNARNSAATPSPSINMPITINVDGAENPKETALEIKRELAVLVRDLKAELSPRSMAKKVASEAERDSERT